MYYYINFVFYFLLLLLMTLLGCNLEPQRESKRATLSDLKMGITKGASQEQFAGGISLEISNTDVLVDALSADLKESNIEEKNINIITSEASKYINTQGSITLDGISKANLVSTEPQSSQKKPFKDIIPLFAGAAIKALPKAFEQGSSQGLEKKLQIIPIIVKSMIEECTNSRLSSMNSTQRGNVVGQIVNHSIKKLDEVGIEQDDRILGVGSIVEMAMDTIDNIDFTSQQLAPVVETITFEASSSIDDLQLTTAQKTQAVEKIAEKAISGIDNLKKLNSTEMKNVAKSVTTGSFKAIGNIRSVDQNQYNKMAKVITQGAFKGMESIKKLDQEETNNISENIVAGAATVLEDSSKLNEEIKKRMSDNLIGQAHSSLENLKQKRPKLDNGSRPSFRNIVDQINKKRQKRKVKRGRKTANIKPQKIEDRDDMVQKELLDEDIDAAQDKDIALEEKELQAIEKQEAEQEEVYEEEVYKEEVYTEEVAKEEVAKEEVAKEEVYTEEVDEEGVDEEGVDEEEDYEEDTYDTDN